MRVPRATSAPPGDSLASSRPVRWLNGAPPPLAHPHVEQRRHCGTTVMPQRPQTAQNRFFAPKPPPTSPRNPSEWLSAKQGTVGDQSRSPRLRALVHVGGDEASEHFAAHGEQWLIGTMLERERRRTVETTSFNRVLRQEGGVNPLEQALKANSAFFFQCDRLKSENEQLEQTVVKLRQQLANAVQRNVGISTGRAWQLNVEHAHLTQERLQNDKMNLMLIQEREHEQQLEAELQSIRRQIHTQKLASTKALRNLQDMELEQMRRAHEAEASRCAATFVQAHERRRRAKAEIDSRRAQARLEDVQSLAVIQMKASEEAVKVDQVGTRFRSTNMTLVGHDGVQHTLKKALWEMLHSPIAIEVRQRRINQQGDGEGSKYARELVLGRPEAAALGIVSHLKIDLFDLFARCTRGLDALREEWEAHGTNEDIECMRYILDEPAGKSDKEFANGRRDRGRNGERLADFVAMPNSQRAQLTVAHVAAIRMYTTRMFVAINEPLRDTQRTSPHPFSATVFFLTDGIKRLRAVHSDASTSSSESISLWRGMKDVKASAAFARSGGSEPAPMSTTSDPAVAVAYGQSSHALLFRIIVKSFLCCGADIGFLSAFPGEKEYLFPPLVSVALF